MTPYSQAFLDAWVRTIGIEVGYSNNPNDRGGETMHGITERVARANGWKGAMKDLPLERAQEIGKTQYWDVLNLDAIAAISPDIAAEMFDTLYNGGEPGQWLQRILNGLNRQGKDYPDMKVDGRIGPMTVSALQTLVAKRGTEAIRVVYNTLNSLQAVRFVAIEEANSTQEDFLWGWLRTRTKFLTT